MISQQSFFRKVESVTNDNKIKSRALEEFTENAANEMRIERCYSKSFESARNQNSA